jgi:tight adherence protein C
MTTWLLYALFFFVVALACHVLLLMWWPRRATRRLSELQRPHDATSQPAPGSRWTRWQQRVGEGLLHVGARLPFGRNKQASAAPDSTEALPQLARALRQRLLTAGITATQSVIMFQAMQALLALLLPLLTGLVLWVQRPALQTASQLIMLILSGMVGYHLPRAWLERRIRHRQAALFRHFPDALDLMRMCIQAGLGLDASLDRVGRETRLSCPALSEEFAMTGYELRAGASRSQALRHLAERIDLRDVDAWVNTLIQSDRFGTSISESLQVYAEALRHKRKLMAQEAAAKLPIKLLVPLVFCLFPGLLVVLLGPAIINISTHLLPALSARP